MARQNSLTMPLIGALCLLPFILSMLGCGPSGVKPPGGGVSVGISFASIGGQLGDQISYSFTYTITSTAGGAPFNSNQPRQAEAYGSVTGITGPAAVWTWVVPQTFASGTYTLTLNATAYDSSGVVSSTAIKTASFAIAPKSTTAVNVLCDTNKPLCVAGGAGLTAWP